jgi:hypothetical protein
VHVADVPTTADKSRLPDTAIPHDRFIQDTPGSILG